MAASNTAARERRSLTMTQTDRAATAAAPGQDILYARSERTGNGTADAVHRRPPSSPRVRLAAERLDEEENQRDEEHVDDERFDQHESEDE